MSAFTENELEFLDGQKLGRPATIHAAGDPHVVPTGCPTTPSTMRSTSAAWRSSGPRSTATWPAPGARP